MTPIRTITIEASSSSCGNLFDIKHVKGKTITEAMERNIEATEIGNLSALNRKAKLYAPLRIPTNANANQAVFVHDKYLLLFLHATGTKKGRIINDVNNSQNAEK